MRKWLLLGLIIGGCAGPPASMAPSPTPSTPLVTLKAHDSVPDVGSGSLGAGASDSSTAPVYAARADMSVPGARPLTPVDFKPPDPTAPQSFDHRHSWLPGYEETANLPNSAPAVVKGSTPQKAGQELWLANCAPCHGANAEGDGRGSVDLREHVRDLRDPWRFKYGATDQAMFRSIAYGLPGSVMGTFKGVLSDDQIWLLVNYLKAIRRKPPGPK